MGCNTLMLGKDDSPMTKFMRIFNHVRDSVGRIPLSEVAAQSRMIVNANKHIIFSSLPINDVPVIIFFKFPL